MQLLVLVLNKLEALEPILEKMLEKGIGGATILDSTGMMRVLDGDDNVDLPMMGLLRHFYSPERKRSKTMFAVIKEEQTQVLIDIINEATGGLDKPDTGIVFCTPISRIEGLEKKK